MSIRTTTNFLDWLSQIDLSDYNTVYELYQVIGTLESCGSFDISSANGSNERWILTTFYADQSLLISGQKARQTLLKIIEDNYCEDMGIEGYFAYHRAMEKED